MESPAANRRKLYGDGILAQIECDRSGCTCRLRIETPRAVAPQRAIIEFLRQPFDRDVLPEGLPVLLHRATLQLLRDPDGQAIAGRCWLPALVPNDVWLACHVVVRPLGVAEEDAASTQTPLP